jgi:hypothetical protein
MANIGERPTTGDGAGTAGSAFGEIRDDLAGKAGDLADESARLIHERADEAKGQLGGSIKALGGALRAARDHLSQNGQGQTSKLMGEAAGGLEGLADSLASKPVGQLMDDMKRFGREHPAGLFAASMFAGLALGRLLRASDEGGAAVASKASQEPEKSTAPADEAGALPVTASSGYAI